MTRVYKYTLQTELRQTINVPRNSLFRHVGLDPKGQMSIWFEVDSKEPSVKMEIDLFPTGIAIDGSPRTFLGTVITSHHVWHIYQRIIT